MSLPLKPVATAKRLTATGFLLSLLISLAHGQPASIQTVQLQSAFVNANVSYNVILPVDYRKSATTRYPVLYLLHGLGGHYSDWIARTNVADYAAQYRMIVITP